VAALAALDDENSPAKVQNVREESSADVHTRSGGPCPSDNIAAAI
jgi:hypothetical protein